MEHDEDSRTRAPRDSLFLKCAIEVTGGRTPIDVRVRNLSPGGMMIDGHPYFFEGARIRTDLRGIGPIEGRIAWVIPERAGVAFDHPVDPKLARSSIETKAERSTYAPGYIERTRRPGLKVRG